MTSVKAAGYQSKPGTGSRAFDPAGGMPTGPAPPLEEKEDSSPAAKAAEMEKRVHRLIEASAEAAAGGDAVMALERAKEAGKRERALVRHRDAKGLSDDNNIDLTFSVFFTLANAYALNGFHAEALRTYDIIYRNKDYDSPGRVKINVGNIHFSKGDYSEALKHYKMALDQLTADNKHLRLRVERNLGVTLIKLGRYQEAIERLEAVVEQFDDTAPTDADFGAAFNLVVCYFALGDRALMKRGFQRLIALPLPGVADGGDDGQGGGSDEGGVGDDDEDGSGAAGGGHADGEPSSSSSSSSSSSGSAGGSAATSSGAGGDSSGSSAAAVSLGKKTDDLAEYLQAKRQEASQLVTTAARLIAPVVEQRSWEAGFDWVVDQLRHDHPQIASEVLVVKALEHLNRRQFDRAIEQLKSFERKEKHHKARAATNLAFLYLLEGDVEQATRFASLAVKHDRYNAKALVNMGNCLCEAGDLDRAKELFLEAIGVEADCVEAIFDLGLVSKQLGVYEEALQAFEKLHMLVPSSPEVLYQLGNLYDAMGDHERTIKYFSYLVSRVRSDPAVLARLGHLFSAGDDETEAFRYHSDSFGYYPVNLDVISFLGIWFVKAELYEKAIVYFERAAEVEPKEAKWRLMVASCYRRMREYERALELYKTIHEEFPDNMECLSYIVAICRDVGRPFQEYEDRLVRLEREQAVVGGGGGEGLQDDDSGDFGGPASSSSRQGGNGGGGFIPDSPSGSADGRGGDSFVPAYDDSPQGNVAVRSSRSPKQQHQHFAAPTHAGGAAAGTGRAVAVGRDDGDDDEFADADLDSMLTE